MATELGRVKSTPVSKYDAVVASQLAQAQTRIRVLDLTAGLLGFAALSLAYIVAMVLCDSQVLFSPLTRQLALYVYLAGAAVYLYWAVIRPLLLRVNPYYAARQVEQQLPHAKNSIVNWVDLHEQALPPAIRGALSQRAAKDLSRVDLDRAISGRRTAWTGGLAGLFAVAFIASFFLLGPRPFLSLLQRMFNPFAAAGVSTRTQLNLLKPEGGNATVTLGRGVNFLVEVNGKVPNSKSADAVKLLYRYEEGEPWLERKLIQEPSRDWSTSLSATEVRNGFWYKITGGDAETEEFQVSVRAAPAILDFVATYRFRPYVARADEVHRERELKALRGTEILLRARTNRVLRDGWLEFVGKKGVGGAPPPAVPVRGEVDPNDPQTLLVRFVLDEDGQYRLFFNSTDSEPYTDPAYYPVTAIPDNPPTVELTKPGQDIRLPADALLHLEGKASDDIGVKSLVLNMRVVGGPKLSGRTYRSDEQLRLADGGYPRELEYKDFVELSHVKGENDPPGSHAPRGNLLRAGMELEYWLEASDACDYPRAHVTESKHYRVLLTEPEKNPQKQNEEKQQAEKDKKQHEQKQDQKLQKENQDRQQQRQEQQARNQEEENKGQSGSEGSKKEDNQGKNGSEGNQGGAGEKSQPRDGKQGNHGENKDNSKQQGENKAGQGEQNKTQEQSGQSQENQKIEERIKKALEKQQAGKGNKDNNKPDKSNQGEGKGGQLEKSSGADNSGSEGKGSDQHDAKETGGEKGKSNPKGGDSNKQVGKAGADKDKPESLPQPGEEKASSSSQADKGTGQDKAKPKNQDPTKGGSQPSADKERQQGKRESTGDTKDNGKRNASKGVDERKDNAKAEKQPGGSASKTENSKPGDAKPAGSKSEGEKPSKNERQPNAGPQEREATTKEIEDLARKLGSKDAREREQAKQQLQRIQKEAADPQAREKAGEALKKQGQQDGPAESGTEKKDGNSSANQKNQGKESAKNNDSSSDKDGDKEKGKGSSQKNGDPGKNGKGSKSEGAPEGSKNSPGGNTPGGGNRRSGGGRSDTHEEATPPRQEKPRDHRAAEMQLEEFAKRVNKDILKEAGVSEEAWKKYLASKRKQLAPGDKQRPEGPSVPQQSNQLPSMGGRTLQPATSGQGDLRGLDRGQPLPQYRDAFRKFTRQMSEKN